MPQTIKITNDTIKRLMDDQLAPERIELGEAFQRGADIVTDARVNAGYATSVLYLVSDEPRTWPRTVLEAIRQAGDKVDGWMAGMASALLRRPCTTEGKRKDEQADKESELVNEGSTALRSTLDGEHLYAANTAATFLVRHWRNRLVGNRRDQATELAQITGVDINVGAIRSGKIKAAVIGMAEVANASPVARRPVGRFVVGAAKIFATGLSVTSGSELIENLDAEMRLAIDKIEDESLRVSWLEKIEQTRSEAALHYVAKQLSRVALFASSKTVAPKSDRQVMQTNS